MDLEGRWTTDLPPTEGSPFLEVIPEGVEITDSGWVPLYYEDRTVIGRARITGNKMEIVVDTEEQPILERMKDTLGGVSLMSRGAPPRMFQEEVTSKGEN